MAYGLGGCYPFIVKSYRCCCSGTLLVKAAPLHAENLKPQVPSEHLNSSPFMEDGCLYMKFRAP